MNTRAALVLITAFLLAGCGGTRQGSAPVYELRATQAPLEYTAEIDNHTTIDTPGGVQEIDFQASIALTLTYASRTAEGLPFEVVFESTGRSRFVRYLASSYHWLARLWPSMFAYQFVLEAEITTLDEESTERRSWQS